MKTKDPDIAHEEVLKRFVYNSQTGVISYRIAPLNQPKSLIGKEAGYIRQTRYGRYRVIKFGKVAVYAHRLIWFYMTGKWPDGHIDHRDGNRLNNTFLNFRVATQSQNKSNSKKPRSNTSGYKGVVKCGLRWKAQITFQQKVIYLGLYDTREEAHDAYIKAAVELQEQFANPG